MSAPMVTSHKWRPPHARLRAGVAVERLDRPCEYLNCRRPRAEHQRVVR